jgi:hypothetical protein
METFQLFTQLSEAMSTVRWINRNAAVLTRSGAVISMANLQPDWDPFPGRKTDTLHLPGAGKEIEIARWGDDNKKPLKWHQLLAESNIAPQLLMTKVDFACGERMFTYKEDLRFDEVSGELKLVKIPVKVPLLDRWLKGLQTEKLMRKRAIDYYFSGNCFNRFVLSRRPEEYGIAWIDHIDSMDGRSETINKKTKRIEHYWISDDWANVIYDPKNTGDNNTIRYKAFRKSNPLKYYKTIFHSKLYWPGHKYYGIQPWHSAENWIAFANTIPVWMNANIDNAYNIKYHIEYPETYFDYTLDWPEEKAKKEKDRFFDEMDEWLAGKDNVAKTFFSDRPMNEHTGEQLEGWKITPIHNEINDKAFVESYKTSQGALTSGWDLNPSLANIPQEGKFAVSGSELRIAYQIHIALKVAAARAIMVEPLELAYQVNHDLGVPGFEDPEIKFGFINRNVVTLAENKTGTTPSIPNNAE